MLFMRKHTKKMLISAVFFDYDGVLTKDKTGSYTTVNFISKELNLPFIKVKKALKRRNTELTLGKITHQDELFDSIVVSAEIGSDKSSSKIFKIALQELNKKPESCIFIDNNEKNLVIPREMGFTTLLHNDT